MSSRRALPPSRAKTSPVKTLQLLQKKLQTAESETVSLVRQLSDMGFQQPSSAMTAKTNGGTQQGKTRKGNTKPESVRPFLASNAESDVLLKSYDAVVARVCRAESQIQTLKLNLCTLQAEKDLHGDNQGKVQEKLTQLRDSHEQEVKKLNREIVIARKEWKDAIEARNIAEEDARRLTSALEIATKTKSELAIEYEEFKSTKSKLNRRVAELREELAREISLRTSLEESHFTLLNRIQEMETVVDAERQEVQTLAQDCSALRREGAREREEKKQDAAYRTQLEEALQRLKSQTGNNEVKFTEVMEENKVLGANLSGLKRENVGLQQQIQQLHSVNAELQKIQATAKMEERRKSLETDRTSFQVELQKLRDANNMAQQKRSELEVELASIKTSFGNQAQEYNTQIQILESTVDELKTELLSIQAERTNAMHAKENLLDEVNHAVDSMTDDRSRLQEQLQQTQLEISVLGHNKTQLQQENNRLLERIASMEQQQMAQQKVDSSMADMLESKNRLAYEKGQLQSRVAELQHQISTLSNTRADLQQMMKSNATLQARFEQTTNELNRTKMTLQRSEGQLRQEQANCQSKEHDFSLAIQARDDAMKQCQTMRQQLATVEERNKQQVASLQRSLSDAKLDHGKIASTLDGVMSSHQQLQLAVERLQTELGRKDSELTSVKHESHKRQQITEMLQREVEQLQAKLVTIETSESDQLEVLQRKLSKVKDEKIRLASTLDELIQTNGQLQMAVEKQRQDAEKSNKEYKRSLQARMEDSESIQEVRDEYEERLGRLREQLLSKKQVGNKRLQRELEEMKTQYEITNEKLIQLSKTASDDQKRVSRQEDIISKQTNRIRSQKTQLAHYHNMKRTHEESSSKMAAIQHQLEEMEKANREYVTKNKDQAKTIASFMSQMKRMESELKAVSRVQHDMTHHTSKRKEVELYKERGKQDVPQRDKTTSNLEQEVCKLRQQRDKAEERLMEVSTESLQISSNLEEAHTWFKTRYDKLQQELAQSKQRQNQLEKINAKQQKALDTERLNATERADKAKSMIRASREALSRVADNAEAHHLGTNSQLQTMTQKLQAERDHSAMTDRKVQQLLNSSAQYIGEISAELELARTQDTPYT